MRIEEAGEGRGGVLSPPDKTSAAILTASARFTAGEEAELQRVLRWLRDHRDLTVSFVIAALEERDHRHTGTSRGRR